MTVLIQKSAGDLSALVSGNEFYRNCYEGNLFTCNVGSANSGYKFLSTTPLAIEFTPSLAGDFLGVVLLLDNIEDAEQAGSVRTITVKLQENTGSWVTRLQQDFSTDDWIPDNTAPTCHGLIDCRFSSTYTITTAAATWRITVEVGVGGDGDFAIGYSQNGAAENNLFFLPYLDTTATLTASDTLCITDKITVDQNLTLAAKDVKTGTQTGMALNNRYYSVWGCTPIVKGGSETVPQLYVSPSVAGDYTVDCSGCYFISAYETALQAGDNAGAPVSANRTFTMYFSNCSSASRHGFVTAGLSYVRTSKLCGIEMWGAIPNILDSTLEAAAASGQADIVVAGDVSSDWLVGDHLMVGGGRYSASRILADYNYNEYVEILSTSYAAGPDETTVTLTANLVRNHDGATGLKARVAYCTRNVVIKSNITASTVNESNHEFKGGFYRLSGVQIRDAYWFRTIYVNKNAYTSAQLAAANTYLKSCNVLRVYRMVFVSTSDAKIEVLDTSSADTGTSGLYALLYISSSDGEVTFSRNILIGKTSYAVYLFGGKGYTISDNHFNVASGIRFTNGTLGHTISGNEFLRCRFAYWIDQLFSTVFANNLYRKTYLDSNDAQDDSTTQGCYGYLALSLGLDNISYDDDTDEYFTLVSVNESALVQHVFNDAKLGSTYGSVVCEAHPDRRPYWISSTRLSFNNYNQVTGDCRNWFLTGYIHSTGVGLPDTTSYDSGAGKKAWRMERYFEDRALKHEMSIPIGTPNEAISVLIYCKVNSLDYDAGVHQPPKLKISGLGVSGESAEAEALTTTTDWQLLIVSGTPTDACQLTITLSEETDAVGSDSYVYWDTVYVSYQTPLNLGSLDLTFAGLPMEPPISLSMVAADVWAELTVANQIAGSFGKVVGDNLDATVSSVSDRLDELVLAAETTAESGSSTTEIRTGLTQADDFFNNMVVFVINSAGVAARNINDFVQSNGAITVDTLPFTPSVADKVFILARLGSSAIDVGSIVSGVFGEALPGSYGAGEAGKIIGDNLDQALSTTEDNIRGTDSDDLKDISDEIATLPTAAEIDTELTASHGGGAWTGSSAEDVADAVWDEAKSGHVGAGTFGKLLQDTLDGVTIVKGLLHENAVVDNQVYNGDDQMTSARIRTYDTKANADTAGVTGLLETYTITATYSSGLLNLYKVTRVGS